MPTLALHIKTNDDTSFLPGRRLVLTYYEQADYGTLQRALDKRKVNHKFVASRKCDFEEMVTETDAYRIEFILYKDWDGLIADEKTLSDGKTGWHNRLQELKKQFPDFK